MPAPDLEKLVKVYAGPQEAIKALPRSQRSELRGLLADSDDPDQDIMRMVNTAFLSERTGKAPADINEQTMATYAREKFGAEVADHGAFYNLVGERANAAHREEIALNEATADLFETFRRGDPMETAARQAMVQLRTKEGFDPDHIDGYTEFFRKRGAEIQQVTERRSEEIALVTDYMERMSKGVGDADKAGADHDSVIAMLKRMPANERAMVLDMASGSLAAAGEEADKEKGFAAKQFGRVARGSERFVAAAVEDVAAFARTSQMGRQVSAPSDFEQDMAIDRELAARISGEVQPLESSNYFAEGFLDFAESLPRMIAFATPAGVAVNVAATRADLRNEYRQRGLTEFDADRLASIAAPIHAAGDFMEARMLFGKVPVMGKALQNIRNPVGNALAVGGTILTAEMAIETGQELVAPIVLSIAGMLTETLPEVDWQEELSSLADQTPETFAAILPMALIGTGVASFRDGRYGLEMMRRRAYLKAVGLQPGAVESVMTADNAETAAARIEQAWKDRDPASAVATSARAEIAAEIAQPVVRTTPAVGSFPAVRKGIQEALPPEMFDSIKQRHLDAGLSEQEATERATKATTPIELFDLTEPLFDPVAGVELPAGSTVARVTLERSGVTIPVQSSQLLEEIMAANPNADRAATEQLLDGKEYVRVDVPVGEVGRPFGVAGREKVDKYAALDPAEAPPIALNSDLRPIDGKHRLAAAEKRGDATIPAYVPADMADQFRPAQAAPQPALGRSVNPELVQRKPDGGFIIKDEQGNPIGEAQAPEMAARVVAKPPTQAEQRTERAQAPIQPSKAPVRPEAEGTRPPEDTTALNMEEIDSLRELFGMEELPAPNRQRFLQVLAGAKRKGLANGADALATSILANPRLINAEEHASMVLRSAELQNQFEQLQNQAAVEADNGNIEKARELEQLSANVMDNLDLITAASDRTGTEIGRALSIRRMRINRRTYTLANIVQRARVAKKAALTPAQTEQLRELSESIADQQATIDRLEKELAKERERADKANAETFVGEGRQRRSAARRQTAAMRRANLKKNLAALGYRLNDITNVVGLSVEASAIVSQIAETYIEEGAATLSEVIGKLKSDIPDLSDQDIFNALGGRIKANRKRIENEARRRVKELQRQARFWAKIHDALNNQFDTATVDKASDKVKALRDILGKLRLQADRAIHDDAALKRIHEKINEVQAQLEGGFRVIAEKSEAKPADKVEVVELKKQLRELERLMRTEDAIADLEEQLRAGNFKVSAPEQRILENAALQDALVKRQQLQRQVNNAIESMRKKTGKEKAAEIILLSRSLRATADMSAALRQGVVLSVRRPVAFTRSFAQAFTSFFDQNSADAIDLAIRRHPNQVERAKAGLFLSDLDINPNGREESFAGSLAERIPGIGRVVRASNRHMTTFLNLMRTAAFDQFLDAHPESTLEQKTAFAAYVNVASGRGDLGRFNQATRDLSFVFFAPKFAVSRFQVPYALMRNWNDATVRNEIAKDFLAFGLTGMTVLALATAAGATVGLDPDDSDFGKIVIGDTRIDIWGGLQQPIRLMLMPIMAGVRRVGLAEEKDVDLIDAGRRFLSYKLSPAVTIPAELLAGQNIIGEETTAGGTLLRSVIPLMVEDTAEVWENTESATKTAMTAALTFVGIGVQEHGPRTERQRAARERRREAERQNP